MQERRLVAPLRAVLAAGSSVSRYGLRDRLAAIPLMAVVGEASTVPETIIALRELRPKLLFLVPDRFPRNGLDLAAQVHRRFPDVRLVVITSRSEIDLVLAYASLRVAAYLVDDDLDGLADDVAAICAGRIVLGRCLFHGLARLLQTPLGRPVLIAAGDQPQSADRPGNANGRHPRRDAVVALAGEGKTDKQIAAELDIAVETVRTHLKRYRSQHGPTPRAALARRPGY